MNYSEYQVLLYKQQAEAQRQANEARAAEQRAREHQTTIQKERERDIGERMYGKLMRDVRESVKPMYPQLWRKKAVGYYGREQTAKIKEEQAKREKEWYERQAKSYSSQLESLRETHEQWEEVEKAGVSGARVHPGGWVKVTDSGMSGMGIAAMSPSQAKASGYKWGSYSHEQRKFVPMPGEPTVSEYLGILKEKKKRGQYEGKSLSEITKIIEAGKVKYGIKPPPWAGADKKEFEKYDKTAREIKQAYLKAAERLKAQEFQAPAKPHKVTEKQAEEYKKAKQDIFGLRSTAIEKHERGMEHFKGMGESRADIEQRVKGQKELIARTEAKAKEYAKGGWTPAEALSYTTFARQTELMGAGVSKRIEKFGEEITGAEKKYKKETGVDIRKPTPEIKKYEKQVESFFGKYPKIQQEAFASFISQKDIERTKEIEKVAAPPPKKKTPTPDITLGALGQIIKDTGKVPTISIDTARKKPHPAAMMGTITAIPATDTMRDITKAKIKQAKAVFDYHPEEEKKLEKLFFKHEDISKRIETTSREKGWIDTKRLWKPETFTSFPISEQLKDYMVSKTPIKGGQITLPVQLTKEVQIWKDEGVKLRSIAEKYGWDKTGVPEDTKAGKTWLKTWEKHEVQTKKFLVPIKTSIITGETEYEYKPEYLELTPEAKKVSSDIKELETTSKQIERQQDILKKKHKGSYLGLMGKYESAEEKYAPSISKIIPPARPYAQVKTEDDLIKAIESTYKYFGQKLTEEEKAGLKESWKEGQKAYATQRKMFGLPPEPFAWEKRHAEFWSGVKAGQIEELREKPVKYVATTGAFVALSPALKGLGIAAKSTGTAWKGTGLAGKLPRVTKVAAWIGKGTPKAVGVGLGTAYAGTVGYELYEAPTPELKGEVVGRTALELAAMGTGFRVGKAITPSYIKADLKAPKGLGEMKYKGEYKGVGFGELKKPFMGIAKETFVSPKLTKARKTLLLEEKHPLGYSLKETQKISKVAQDKGAFATQIYREKGIGRGKIRFEKKDIEAIFGEKIFLAETGKVTTPKTEHLELPPHETRDIAIWSRGKETSLTRIPTGLAIYKEPVEPKLITPHGLRLEKRKLLTYKTLIPERLFGFETGYKAFQIGKYPKHTKIFYEHGKVPKTGRIFEKPGEYTYPSEWFKAHHGIKGRTAPALEEPFGLVSTEIAHIGKAQVEYTPLGKKTRMAFAFTPVRTYARGYKPPALPEWFDAPKFKGRRVEFLIPEELVGTPFDIQKIKASDIIKGKTSPELKKIKEDVKRVEFESMLARALARKVPIKHEHLVTSAKTPDVRIVKIPKFEYESIYGVKSEFKPVRKEVKEPKIIDIEKPKEKIEVERGFAIRVPKPLIPEISKTEVRFIGIGEKVGRVPFGTKIMDIRKYPEAETYRIIGEAEKVRLEMERTLEKVKYAETLGIISKAEAKAKLTKIRKRFEVPITEHKLMGEPVSPFEYELIKEAKQLSAQIKTQLIKKDLPLPFRQSFERLSAIPKYEIIGTERLPFPEIIKEVKAIFETDMRKLRVWNKIMESRKKRGITTEDYEKMAERLRKQQFSMDAITAWLKESGYDKVMQHKKESELLKRGFVLWKGVWIPGKTMKMYVPPPEITKDIKLSKWSMRTMLRQKRSRVKTIAEKEAEIEKKIKSGEFIAHKDSFGRVILQKVETKQETKTPSKMQDRTKERKQKQYEKLLYDEPTPTKRHGIIEDITQKRDTVFGEFKIPKSRIAGFPVIIHSRIRKSFLPSREFAPVKEKKKQELLLVPYSVSKEKTREQLRQEERQKTREITGIKPISSQIFKPFSGYAFKPMEIAKLKEETKVRFASPVGEFATIKPIEKQKFKYEYRQKLETKVPPPPPPIIIIPIIPPPPPLPKGKEIKRKKKILPRDFYHFPEITRIKTPEELLGFFK